MITYNTQFLDKPILFIAIPHGSDFAVSIMGGDAFHIGASATCIPGSISTVVSVPGHKEESLVLDVASSISHALDCVVSVSIGIHYNHVSKEEIDQIVQLVHDLKDDFLKFILLNRQVASSTN